MLSGKGIPLIGFGSPRQTRRGVSVTVRKGRREKIPHAFIQTMRSGHRGVFMRYSTKKMKRKDKAAIRQLRGPTVTGVFGGAPGVARRVMSKIGTTLQKNVSRNLDLILRGIRK